MAKALSLYRGPDTVVYALPRGGVVLGAVVARELHAPLSLLVPRKIGHPENPEFAIAAVGEDGELIGSQALHYVDQGWLRQEAERQTLEAQRRKKVFLKDQKQLNPQNKVCLIVDDGLATGLTMRAAVAGLRKQKAGKIVVAVPVGPADTVQILLKEADECICLYTPKDFRGSIGYYYQNFAQVEDAEVVSIMDKSKPIKVS